MRLPRTAHTSRPWRIHEVARDFQVEDVWELPVTGGPEELDRLVRQFTNSDGTALSAPVVRTLFAIRWKLGALLGWDKADAGLDGRVGSLRERLPEDLCAGTRGPDLQAVPFTSVYQTRDEWVAESANRTVHAVMHIAWVPDPAPGAPGRHRARMAVLVKPNGLLGAVYMAGIKPFRYLGVYPKLLGAIGREWEAGKSGEAGKPGKAGEAGKAAA
ncbi:DUF2867 domain-containing protein [Streptomyces sp. NBC_00094]|uniref:DUF2867 domain-containing protein n=1 Tax=Streptomyces sp. NBC_00094 TaxID=2903620 RepID=UPI00224E9245|nr:DUF2867 domain-containing protein [Streptomyces sp. NBC_00094]MCX5393144.1 DUF2867 domain-containing protein [Streptomyces sp. NBC_00094]